MMSDSPEKGEVTTDAWYDGSLRLTQPARQHGLRATSDSALLACTIPIASHPSTIWEFGVGAGAVALIVLKRQPAAQVTGVDCDAGLLALAKHNAEANGFGGRLAVIPADLTTQRFTPTAQHVLMNPPYNDPASTPPASRKLRAAKASAFCPSWIEAAASCLLTKGSVTVITRTECLVPLLDALTAHGFGESVIKPIHASLGRAANRVLVKARKGVAGGVAILPPLLRDSSEYKGLVAGGHISLAPPGRRQGRVRAASFA